jgi:hypothetical protein
VPVRRCTSVSQNRNIVLCEQVGQVLVKEVRPLSRLGSVKNHHTSSAGSEWHRQGCPKLGTVDRNRQFHRLSEPQPTRQDPSRISAYRPTKRFQT